MRWCGGVSGSAGGDPVWICQDVRCDGAHAKHRSKSLSSGSSYFSVLILSVGYSSRVYNDVEHRPIEKPRARPGLIALAENRMSLHGWRQRYAVFVEKRCAQNQKNLYC